MVYKYQPPKSKLVTNEKNQLPTSYTSQDVKALLEKEYRKNTRKFGNTNLNGYWQRIYVEEKKGLVYTEPVQREKKIVYHEEETALKSNYLYYKPTGILEQQKMESIWEDHINRQVSEKRTAEEFVHHMKSWSNARQRVETEIIRKTGQSYAGSRYENRAFRLTNTAYDNFRHEGALMNKLQSQVKDQRHINSAWRKPNKDGMTSAYQTTRPGTVGTTQRPFTGNTIYYHKKGEDPLSKKGITSQMFRKPSGRPLQEEVQLRKTKGYYQDLNSSRDQERLNRSIENSIESSVEIVEDLEELDEGDEEYIKNLEKGAIKKQLHGKAPGTADINGGFPKIIDTGTINRPLTVTTTYTKAMPKYMRAETTVESQHGEKYMDQQKIKMMRVRSNIKFELDPEAEAGYKKNQLRTLSVYAKPNRDLDNQARPFTHIMTYDQVRFRRNNQLREIDDIKHRLNRNKVNIPLKKIETALLNPLEEDIKVEEGLTYALPTEAEGLLSNPLFKKKKKTKGKRGKSKKKKAR